MASFIPYQGGNWRSRLFPTCPLPPERQRYFDTLSRLYVIVATTYVVGLLPMFWLLGDSDLLLITIAALGLTLGSQTLHRRGRMASGVALLLVVMTWHMLEALRAFGTGLGFELYFAIILLVTYISAMSQGVKTLVSLAVLTLVAVQLISLREQTVEWPLMELGRDLLLVANLVIVSVLFAVILGGLEGVTERLERNYRREATSDALTGVCNRRGLLQVGERAIRDKRPFALLLLDVDRFKRINDNYGHALGDRALCHLVECLGLGLREQDVLGRYGGEEFVVVMHDMTLADASVVAERLATLVRERPFAVTNQPLYMTVSIGVAASSQATSLERLIALADRRLYRAKRAGRDRVVADDLAFDDATPDPLIGMPVAMRYG